MDADGLLDTAMETASYASGNVLWPPVRNVLSGVEVLAGLLEQKGGESNHDIRTQVTAQYKF